MLFCFPETTDFFRNGGWTSPPTNPIRSNLFVWSLKARCFLHIFRWFQESSPSCFRWRKLGQWKQRESFGSDKFTSLCIVDMMIICSIYFHSYGKIIVHNVYETSHLSYFCAATKEWFPLLPLESCCKSDKSFTYCLFIGNSIYMCIQYVYISVYIYIYLDLPMWSWDVPEATGPCTRDLSVPNLLEQFLVGDHGVFAAMNLDVDMM